jgi:hypothetical protein
MSCPSSTYSSNITFPRFFSFLLEHDHHQDHDLCMIKVLTIDPLPVIILKITSEERYEMHAKGPTTDRSVPGG